MEPTEKFYFLCTVVLAVAFCAYIGLIRKAYGLLYKLFFGAAICAVIALAYQIPSINQPAKPYVEPIMEKGGKVMEPLADGVVGAARGVGILDPEPTWLQRLVGYVGTAWWYIVDQVVKFLVYLGVKVEERLIDLIAGVICMVLVILLIWVSLRITGRIVGFSWRKAVAICTRKPLNI